MKLDFSLLEGLELSGVVEPSDAPWNLGLIRKGAEGVQKRLGKKISCKNAKPNERNSFNPHIFAYIKGMFWVQCELSTINYIYNVD